MKKSKYVDFQPTSHPSVFPPFNHSLRSFLLPLPPAPVCFYLYFLLFFIPAFCLSSAIHSFFRQCICLPFTFTSSFSPAFLLASGNPIFTHTITSTPPSQLVLYGFRFTMVVAITDQRHSPTVIAVVRMRGCCACTRHLTHDVTPGECAW